MVGAFSLLGKYGKICSGGMVGAFSLLGKYGLVFPKLTKGTIHMNNTHSGKTRQNTDTK